MSDIRQFSASKFRVRLKPCRRTRILRTTRSTTTKHPPKRENIKNGEKDEEELRVQGKGRVTMDKVRNIKAPQQTFPEDTHNHAHNTARYTRTPPSDARTHAHNTGYGHSHSHISYTLYTSHKHLLHIHRQGATEEQTDTTDTDTHTDEVTDRRIDKVDRISNKIKHKKIQLKRGNYCAYSFKVTSQSWLAWPSSVSSFSIVCSASFTASGSGFLLSAVAVCTFFFAVSIAFSFARLS